MNLLTSLASLYRLLKKPQVSDSHSFVSENVELTEDLVNEIIKCWGYSEKSGLSVEVKIGKKYLGDTKKASILKSGLNTSADTIKVEIPRKGSSQFYKDISDFITRNSSIHRGILPDNFFISEIDYLHSAPSSDTIPIDIKKIKHFCGFIHLIKETSHFIDSKNEKIAKAIFVTADEESKITTPKSINLRFDKKLLELDEVDLDFLEEIIGDSGSTHKEEKLSIFRVTIWEMLSFADQNDSNIYFLALHWQDIKENYFSTYEIYIRGFSFTKFSSEVQDYIHDTIAKSNDLVGNIAIKVLTVPSLFSLWLIALKIKKLDDVFIISLCATLTVSSAVIAFVVENQQYLAEKLASSSKKRIENFMRKSNYSAQQVKRSKLDNFITEQEADLKTRLNLINRKLFSIRVSIWLFVLVAFFTTIHSTWRFELHYLIVIFVSTVTLYFGLFKYQKSKTLENRR